MNSIVGRSFLLAFLILWMFSVATGFTPNQKPPSVTGQDLCGIWKLTVKNYNNGTISSDNLRLTSSPVSSVDPTEIPPTKEIYGEIVMRLDEDGTFGPCKAASSTIARSGESEVSRRLARLFSFSPLETDGAEPSCSSQDYLMRIFQRGGFWEYREDGSLVLACNRLEEDANSNFNGKLNLANAPQDTVLVGKLLVHVSECLVETEGSSPLPDDGGSVGEITLPTPPKDADSSSSKSNNNNNLDVHLSVPQGQVSMGKFLYPRKHAAFFDQPMLFQPATIGTFSLTQLLGNLNTRLQKQKEKEKQREAARKAKDAPELKKFHKKDFYNRTFYVTATPHPVHQGYAAQDIHYDESKAVLDISVMPITFHPNNTFTAIGTEKILRGRYGITDSDEDKGGSLWFQTSLYGAGRSAPGSVYSEGRLLSQDDRRGYVGKIQDYPNKNNRTVYFVDGEFYYGSGTGKRNSMGTFTLQEIDEEEREENGEDGGSSDVIIERDGNTIGSFPWDDDELEDAFQ